MPYKFFVNIPPNYFLKTALKPLYTKALRRSATFAVYNFLRKTRQLEREVVSMKPSILMPLIMELEYLKNPR